LHAKYKKTRTYVDLSTSHATTVDQFPPDLEFSKSESGSALSAPTSIFARSAVGSRKFWSEDLPRGGSRRNPHKRAFISPLRAPWLKAAQFWTTRATLKGRSSTVESTSATFSAAVISMHYSFGRMDENPDRLASGFRIAPPGGANAVRLRLR